MELNKNDEEIIHILQDLLLENSESPLLSLVEFVYPQILHNTMSLAFFDYGAFLCPYLNLQRKSIISI